MTNFGAVALVALAVFLLPLLVGCGNGQDAGPSRAEVEEIVDERIRTAIADVPQSQPPLTSAGVEEIARGIVASIPPRSAPSDYTKFFVQNAIIRYDAQGLDATLAHYNRGESIDGQWYGFIVDENDLVIGHPDPNRLGLDLRGWVGTDANGYNFGPEMLSATEDGKWVSYVYENPETGGLGADFGQWELKNVWVVRHDGLLFASGWYISADEFTKQLVSIAIDKFRSAGLQATIDTSPAPRASIQDWQRLSTTTTAPRPLKGNGSRSYPTPAAQS